MKKISTLFVLAALLFAAPASAQDYAACVVSGVVKICPGNVRLKGVSTLALANIPTMDAAHLPIVTEAKGGFGADVSGLGTGYLKRIGAATWTAASIPAGDLPSGIDPLKIGAGLVSGTVFGYLANVSSDIQAQLNGKQATLTLPLSKANGGFGADVSTGLTNNLVAYVTGGALVIGALPVAAIASALAAGGNPITGTIVDASVRMDTPTIGTNSSNQHALPSGTAALVASDNSRLPPAPTTAGKIVIDTGVDYTGIAVAQTKYVSAGSNSWSPAATTKRFFVQAWGAGAGGGSGRQGTNGLTSAGGGGGGGAYSERMFLVSEITAPVTVIVGAGSAGGATQSTSATNGNPAAANGGASSFGAYLRANGGVAGNGGTNATTAAALGGTGEFSGQSGLGGLTTATNGVAAAGLGAGGGGGGGPLGNSMAPAAGANGGNFPGALYSAGASGGATPGLPGSDGASGFSGLGGGGGASGDNAGTVVGGKGGNGGAPGGGGGGGGASVNGVNSGAGGNGADGAMWITEYPF